MSQGKNTYGLGSTYQRKDGYWVASVRISTKRIVSYHKTEREAKQKVNDTLREYQLGTFASPTKTTVHEFTEQWLSAIQADVKPTTYVGYQQLCRLYVNPTLGHLKLHQLKPANIVAALAQWRKRDVASGTVLNAYRCLHRCLACAVKWGMLPKNPCDTVEAPKVKRQEATVWTIEEAKAFLEATRSDRYHTLWLFLAGTGCRLGEALGATWADVDWENSAVRIRHSASYVKGKWIIQEPKTRESKRTIALPGFVMGSLREWRKRQLVERTEAGTEWMDERNGVFLTITGAIPKHHTIRSAFLQSCERAGVPACRRHDLRHLAATLLIGAGLDPKAVQARLGHSTITMTMQLYTHAVRGKDRLAAEAIEQVFGSL